MEIRLTTTVGGQFDFAVIRKAIDAQGPLEPETEYVLRVDLAPAAPAAPSEAPPETVSARGRRRSEPTAEAGG